MKTIGSPVICKILSIPTERFKEILPQAYRNYVKKADFPSYINPQTKLGCFHSILIDIENAGNYGRDPLLFNEDGSAQDASVARMVECFREAL